MPRKALNPRMKQLRLRQLDNSLSAWRELRTQGPPPSGWAKAIREALGIREQQLGKSLGITRAGIQALERNEAARTITLASLTRLADALGCELVYALVPRAPLRQMLETQAERKAAEIVDDVNHTMQLEEQPVSAEATSEYLQQVKDRLMRETPRSLWDEEVRKGN